jgi:hypothetical protein
MVAWGIVVGISKTVIAALVLVAVLIVAGNLAFHAQRGTPYRALAPEVSTCKEDADTGWDVLSRTD